MAAKDDKDGPHDAADLAHLAQQAGGLTRAVQSLLEEPKAAKKRAIFGMRDPDQTQLATHVRLAVIESTLSQPDKGAVSVANRLRQRGFNVDPSHVKGIWQQYKLSMPDKRRQAKVRSKEMLRQVPKATVVIERPLGDDPKQHLMHLTLAFASGVFFAALVLRIWLRLH